MTDTIGFKVEKSTDGQWIRLSFPEDGGTYLMTIDEWSFAIAHPTGFSPPIEPRRRERQEQTAAA